MIKCKYCAKLHIIPRTTLYFYLQIKIEATSFMKLFIVPQINTLNDLINSFF